MKSFKIKLTCNGRKSSKRQRNLLSPEKECHVLSPKTVPLSLMGSFVEQWIMEIFSNATGQQLIVLLVFAHYTIVIS